MNKALRGGRKMAELRKIIGKSQTQFAAMLGVSKHTIISVENGRNQLSQNLARRIQLATGANVLDEDLGLKHIGSITGTKDLLSLTDNQIKFFGNRYDHKQYTREDFELWRANFYPSNDETARKQFAEIKNWIELVFRAAAKPGIAGNRDRLPAVRQSLMEWLEAAVENFKLAKEIDDILEAETHHSDEFGFDAAIVKNPSSALELKQLKDAIASYGYDFAEVKKYCKKAKPTDWIFLETETRTAWNPSNGKEVIPCIAWKVLKKPKIQIKTDRYALAQFMKHSKIKLIRDHAETQAKEQPQTASSNISGRE